MSNYRNSDFLNDFTTRTKENLTVIDYLWRAKEKSLSLDLKNKLEDTVLNANVYEVTLRINSFFGFIILPFEKYNFDFKRGRKTKLCIRCFNDDKISIWVKKIKNILLKCLNEGRFYCNYNDMKKTVAQYDFEHVIKIIRHLRNSIAHGGNKGIMFYPLGSDYEKGSDVQIEDIIFHDKHEHKDGYLKGKTEQFCIKLNVVNELDEMWDAIVNLFIRIEEIDIDLLGQYKSESNTIGTINDLNKLMWNYNEKERFK